MLAHAQAQKISIRFEDNKQYSNRTWVQVKVGFTSPNPPRDPAGAYDKPHVARVNN